MKKLLLFFFLGMAVTACNENKAGKLDVVNDTIQTDTVDTTLIDTIHV